MLLRDAQDQARVAFAAQRNRGQLRDPEQAAILNAARALHPLSQRSSGEWDRLGYKADQSEAIVGTLLIAAMALANQLGVDSDMAMRNALLHASP